MHFVYCVNGFNIVDFKSRYFPQEVYFVAKYFVHFHKLNNTQFEYRLETMLIEHRVECSVKLSIHCTEIH